MNSLMLTVPLDVAVPAGAGATAFGTMAASIGAIVATAALIGAAGAGVVYFFPQLVARAPEPQTVPGTGEILPTVPAPTDQVRRYARMVLRAALIWAAGGAVVGLVGAIATAPTLVYPALSILIAAGVLLAVIATGHRLAGTRTFNGIPLKNLIYTGIITAVVATAVLVLLSLIFTSPATISTASGVTV